MRRLITLLFLFCLVISCTDNDDQPNMLEDSAPRYVDLAAYTRSAKAGRTATGNYAVLMAEYLTTGESSQVGNTIFFKNVGNKQLAGDFVPALSLDETTAITYYIDENRPSNDLATTLSSPAIDRSMETWNNLICSELGMTKVTTDGRPTGFIAELLGYSGSFDYVADVTHCGWLPGGFFDILATGGSSFILGVTFTIVFTDDDGNLVDTDNNGKYDVAWREIYYNDNFTWKNGARYDVETVSLHESGHGLSQAHFGKAFINNGGLHFAPRAVMNAAYSGVQLTIDQTDNAGHCSNWAQWPNN